MMYSQGIWRKLAVAKKPRHRVLINIVTEAFAIGRHQRLCNVPILNIYTTCIIPFLACIIVDVSYITNNVPSLFRFRFYARDEESGVYNISLKLMVRVKTEEDYVINRMFMANRAPVCTLLSKCSRVPALQYVCYRRIFMANLAAVCMFSTECSRLTTFRYVYYVSLKFLLTAFRYVSYYQNVHG